LRRHPRLSQTIALLIAVALLFVANLNIEAIAADSAESPSPAAVAGNNDLDSLEKRFFEHTYAKDSMDQRLERLEKMVFGEVRPGSDQERLANLQAAVPADTSTPVETPAAQAANNAPTQTTSSADSTDTQSGESDSGDYPTVSALETEILGQSYPHKAIRQRLSALETKAFGAVSTSDDLSDRVTLLQRYASEHNLDSPPSYSSTYPSASNANTLPPTAPPAANSPLEARVSWLERQVYGSASTGKPLINRVKRLDKTLLPDEHLDTTESLPENVNTLINSYQLTHNPTGPKSGGVEFANKSNNAAPYNYDSNSAPNGQPAATPYGTTATQPYTPSPAYDGQNNAYQAQNNAYQAQNPGTQPQTTPYQPSTYGYQSANSNLPSQSSAPTQHHSLLHGLAKVLGAVGSMTMGGIGYGGMGGYGMGMPGMGYGMPGMGYGMPGMGYGMPGMGYGMPGMGYGMGGGFPGFHY
jgi:hypothetical protein